MKLSILCIGDELLKGFTVNTVQPKIGQSLLELGVIAEKVLTVKDERPDLEKALDYLLEDSDVIITTGGLGPTADDITKKVVAEYFGENLVVEQGTVDKIMHFYKIRGIKRKPTEQILSQALIPESATIMPNNVGTAPGLRLQKTVNDRLRTVFMLPGPPNESIPILYESLIPAISELIDERIYSRAIYAAGIPESVAEEKVQAVVNGCKGLGLAYCASPEVLKIFLSSKDESLVEDYYGKVCQAMDSNVMKHGKTLPEDIVGIMRDEKMVLATAESCTGGMIASAITDIPGSSEMFCGSVVVYSNEWKKGLLSVSEKTLQTRGAVSEECARQMVENLCAKFATDAGIAVTGIAGPGGGGEEKPVGTVFIGVACKGDVEVIKRRYPGDRANVRYRTVATALNLLRSKLIHDPDVWY